MWRNTYTAWIFCACFSALPAIGITNNITEEPIVKNNTSPLPPIYIEKEIKLQKNDALTTALIRNGFSNKQAHAATHGLKKKIALNLLRPGDSINVTYPMPKNGAAQNLMQLSFNAPKDKIATVTLNSDDSYSTKVKARPLVKKRSIAVGHIKGSLYQSAAKANLPAALVPAFANLFAYELDFTRDIRKGDIFRVIFEEVLDEKGEYVRSGNVLAAELYARGKKRSAYRFKNERGLISYYDEKGSPKKKLLLRTPLEFTRISSHFNPTRKHPILGYTKAHKGTDFAAPTGTPVKSSGNGVVEYVGWHGAYGKYVRIKHTGKYKTAYAHLSRYARGLKKGKKVRQGQVIAYVGSTGRSTGPHLHYEVHVYGKRVNAMKAKLPAGNPLPRKFRGQFNKLVAGMKNMWKQTDIKLAQTLHNKFDG